MDEFNNAPNPFNEDNNGNSGNDPNKSGYNMPSADPFNQQPVQKNSQYNMPYGQPTGQQNTNPYDRSAQQLQQPQQYNIPNGQYQQNYTYTNQNIPQQGYVQPQGYGMPYQQPQSTGMAVASLVLGIISITMGLFMFAVPVLFLVPIIGLILGIVFKCKRLSVGKGLSTAGIITSSIGLAIPVLLLIFVMVMLVTHGAELMEYVKQVSPDQYNELYELYGDQFPEWFSDAISMFIK